MQSADEWEQMLNQLREDGARDAEKGLFSPPCIALEDPQDEYQAYKEGFMRRRRELGENFKWKHGP